MASAKVAAQSRPGTAEAECCEASKRLRLKKTCCSCPAGNKTFCFLNWMLRQHGSEDAKVFWVFSSEKNSFFKDAARTLSCRDDGQKSLNCLGNHKVRLHSFDVLVVELLGPDEVELPAQMLEPP